MDFGPIARRWLDQLPQESFADIVRQRDALPNDDPRQKPLSIEDRRAFAREYTREHGMLGGLAMGLLAPAEQVAKAVLPVPSRSGFHEPLASIGAGWTGVIQGLDDRGLFGGR